MIVKYLCSILFSRILLKCRGVRYGHNLQAYGIPLIKKNRSAEIKLGDNVVLTSLSSVNPAGVSHRIILAAPFSQSLISIGDGTGISGAVIFAAKSIKIGSFVNVGVNTRIYDCDFHSMNYLDRRKGLNCYSAAKPVVIEDDVWIGANCLILKGVTVSRGAVIGAGSVVTKNVPSFEVWAGNPAKFIKKIEDR